jgi:hypothetical protein
VTPKLDILDGGIHIYWSTHCRHGNHDACSATVIEGRQVGERVRLPRKPAQCKTCAAPCICPCHKSGTKEEDGDG